MNNRNGRTAVAALAALALPLTLAGCGLGQKETSVDITAGSIDAEALKGVDVVVGSKDFDEQLVLGQLTILALAAAGANTTNKTNIQGSTATREALLGGDIDVYWDYTGTGWINYLLHEKPIPDAQEQYEAVRKEDLAKNDIVWGEPAPMNNTYAIAVADEFAKEKDLSTVSDMAELAKSSPADATICVESEFSARPDGLPGMQAMYGMDIPSGNIKKFGVGVVYTELDKGQSCNFGEVFTTDGRVATLGLTVLEDDKAFFPLYNAVPMVMSETDKANPEILEVLQPLAEALTTEEITKLNARVSSEGEKPATVAEDFLREKGFIE